MQYRKLFIITLAMCGLSCSSVLKSEVCRIDIGRDNSISMTINGVKGLYNPRFVVIYAANDPQIKMRPAGIKNVQYNAVSWLSDSGEAQQVERKDDQAGDGFDDSILEGDMANRTFDMFNVAENIDIAPSGHTINGEEVLFQYATNDKFSFESKLTIDPKSGYPMLSYKITPKTAGYYSVGYCGFEGIDTSFVKQLWQPMIWQERRFPDRSYLTLAFRCPIASAFIQDQRGSYGVVAHPDEFPFDPLPTMNNSRFGVGVRNQTAMASPMLFTPVLGGVNSQMADDHTYSFKALLFKCVGNTTDALELAAKDIYGFRDYRHNEIGTLNGTIDNIIDYVMSDYSWFIDAQKGCAYSTDVPDAVKNVSCLNPLEIALINDNPAMYEKRAYPILEYMLSREKFLFSPDSLQRIQFPSRRLNGPCAPISELATAYNVFGKRSGFLLDLAKKEYKSQRVRNLDVMEQGETWRNALYLYKATGENKYLEAAKKGADLYMKCRTQTQAIDFSDPDAGGFFFWTGYTPKWIDLLELYEATLDERYLKAAHDGAKLYAQYIWFAPAIPDMKITVNPDGKAPHYAYLKQKGHIQMDAPREEVDAWRLSEIGLTPESSGTCAGHRGIFMANYAAWMVRMAYYTGDKFLADIAKSAIIGRYTNFPGYHINTLRTTIYEKNNYPQHKHKELSVNSFHYNHIMPHVSLLYDYLISDMLYRSNGKIRFPDEFIEAYAYLQSKFYGHKAGKFYDNDAWLWMPKGLLSSSNVEANYLSARGDGKLYIAFSNQSDKQIKSDIKIDSQIVRLGKSVNIKVLSPDGAASQIKSGEFNVTVPANGLTAVVVEDAAAMVKVQDALLATTPSWSTDHATTQDNMVETMITNIGSVTCNVYTYLKVSDTEFTSATIDVNGTTLTDKSYPYEFTLPATDSVLNISVSARRLNGQTYRWDRLMLKK